MRRLGISMLVAMLPAFALAEPVYIRIEAKRDSAAAAEAAQGWAEQLGLPAVSFPLGKRWTAVALGPLERAEAETRMEALKSARRIPADSLLSPAAGIIPNSQSDAATAPSSDNDTTGAGSVTLAPTPEAATPADNAATESAPAPITLPKRGFGRDAFAAPPPDAIAPDRFLRLASFTDVEAATAALTETRKNIPEAGLWQDGERLHLAVGPLREAPAKAWLTALRNGKVAPKKSNIVALSDLGIAKDRGSQPDWPAPPESPAALPPLKQIQSDLRWAGFYDGAIDGQTGPKTRAAIAAEIASQRVSPDPGTALIALSERRAAWRQEVGLDQLDDDHSGLSLIAPLGRLAHERVERNLSIYGPRDGSGAALILFAQPGGQQEMLDMTGLVTALGWVPAPKREITKGRASLRGENETHIGMAEARLRDGMAEGFVLIWPVADRLNADRLIVEATQSFSRSQPTRAQRAEAEARAHAEAQAAAEAAAAQKAAEAVAPSAADDGEATGQSSSGN